jgi:ATP/maltotriose-dependent transcriptional regulator MalT
MYGRLTSTHLVGRGAELTELERAYTQASAGRPGLVLISGDSGVGKTRLLSELERQVSDEAHVLRGEAVQTGDGELPYGLLLGALRPLVRERHPVLERLAAGNRATLAVLLPGLEDRAAGSEREDPAAQLRLFEALLELLHRLGSERPVVLVLEDIHWADRSSRAFLAYLARSVRDEHLLVLATFRSDELHRRHPLRPLLAELERVPLTRLLHLEPLGQEELREVLADILGEPPAPALVRRLYERAEGNPLFTEELLAADRDGRGAAPQSLRDAFMLRIERLSREAQRAVRAIAVGRSLPEPLIAELAGFDRPAAQEALREAVAAQIIVLRDEECLCFRHELLREALYEDLLPGERSELHLALAQLLERRAEDGTDRDPGTRASVAAHYAAAGAQPEALRASVEAARAARAVYAPGEAAELAERALELWPRVPEAERLAGIDHLELQLFSAWSHLEDGQPTRAEHILQRALSGLDPEQDPSAVAAVLEALSHTQWSLNRGLDGVRTAKRALALVGEHDACQRVALLGWLARTEYLRGRFREASADAEEALAAAREAGDRVTEAQAMNTLAMAEIMSGQLERGRERMQCMIELCESRGDLDSASYGYANLADLLIIAGRTREGLEVARAGLEMLPAHLRSARDWLTMTVSEAAFVAGDWKLSRAHLGPPPSEFVGVRLIFRLLREAELALGVGDEDAAAAALEALAPLVERSSEPQWIAAHGALASELHRRRRELPQARAAVARALDRIEVCSDDVTRIARASGAGLRVEADIAQRARDLREPAEAKQAIIRARLHMQRLQAAASEGGPVEAAWLATGRAELARARGRDDVAAWEKAIRAWEQVQRPYEVSVARWRAAEAAAGAGDRARAGELAAAGLECAQRVGSRWLAGELRALIQRARLSVGAPAGGEAAPAPVPTEDAPFGLTPREREVLVLIAGGATNRQIGGALYMAEKTASVHVSRILAKLGVRTRTEAAAVAHREGLDRDLAARP